ncbi:MAG: hypothetical protein JJT78_18145 [Leptospira sp.]|nr:hypothetical protein [Leptospira sp.]
MGFFSNLFSKPENKSELDKYRETLKGSAPIQRDENEKLHDEVSFMYQQNVTSEMLTEFANSLSLEKIETLTGDDWNNFMEGHFPDLEAFLEGVAEGGGVETEWNEKLLTYRT